MPFYEYECQACKYYAEVMQKIGDPPLMRCPSCGKRRMKRLVSAPVFRLKGGGWYETDFKSDKEAKRNLLGAEKEAAKAESKGEAKEAKPEAAAKEAKPETKAPAEGKGAGATEGGRAARSRTHVSFSTRAARGAAHGKRSRSGRRAGARKGRR